MGANRWSHCPEDWEIYGAESGVVTVDYCGACTARGLELNFREEHRIPGLGES